jgi:hypothetical protein
MTTWSDEEIGRIGDAEELQLASERQDGTLRPYVTMWVVRAGMIYTSVLPTGQTTPGTAVLEPAVPAGSGQVVWSAT